MKNRNTIMDEADVALIIIGLDDGKIRYSNRKVFRDLDLQEEDIINQKYDKVFGCDFILVYNKLVASSLDWKTHTSTFYWKEKSIWEQLSVHLSTWEDNSIVVYLTITNVTPLAQELYKHEWLAYFDGLLELPNGLKLEQDVQTIENYDTAWIIYCRIDRLSDINKLYGWETGDFLLRAIKDWFLSTERENVSIYTMPKSFILFSKNKTLQDAKDRSVEIINRFKTPFSVPFSDNTIPLYCPVEVGIVQGKYMKSKLRSLLSRSLLAPKTKEGYSIYDEKVDIIEKEKLKLKEIFINCVQSGMQGFEVYHQPIVDAKTKCWTGIESLCRFTTPDGTSISPMVFIPMAEQLGLIQQIDAWVRKTAIQHCIHLGLTNKEFFLDVNFSPNQVINEKLMTDLLETTSSLGFPIENLQLEITESVHIKLQEHEYTILNSLLGMGLKLGIDDFGTGYSSLENLLNLPANTIKVDKVFIDDIVDDTFKQLLLRSITQIAKFLNMKIIVEGVETKEQYLLLKEMDIDYIQGYFFSKPLSFDTLKAKRHNFSPSKTQ